MKTAFLYGDLDEKIYIKQPKGYTIERNEKMVCKLKMSLYGLKQEPGQWYLKFDSFMTVNGFRGGHVDYCCYNKNYGNSYIIMLIYIDDMLVAGSSIHEINNLKDMLSREFKIKNLGVDKQIPGMRITRERKNHVLRLSQEDYIEKILKRFNI